MSAPIALARKLFVKSGRVASPVVARLKKRSQVVLCIKEVEKEKKEGKSKRKRTVPSGSHDSEILR